MSKAKLITEQIKKIRPLIKEATPAQKLKLVKLMKVALKEGFDERMALIRKLASTGKYDVSDLELASDEELQQLLSDENHEGLDEGGDVFMPNIKDTPEYKAGFATGKLPVPYPEGTQQYANYYKGVIDKSTPNLNKGVAEGEIDEAKIHFTDPSTKVNLYYIPPKLQAQGQVQNVAHNIPYSTVEPLINRLMQKYPSMNPDYMVWYPLGKDKYGQRLEEKQDYLEEK